MSLKYFFFLDGHSTFVRRSYSGYCRFLLASGSTVLRVHFGGNIFRLRTFGRLRRRHRHNRRRQARIYPTSRRRPHICRKVLYLSSSLFTPVNSHMGIIIHTSFFFLSFLNHDRSDEMSADAASVDDSPTGSIHTADLDSGKSSSSSSPATGQLFEQKERREREKRMITA